MTVLFTDLLGSTELNQELGDEIARIMGRAVEQLVLVHHRRDGGAPRGAAGDRTPPRAPVCHHPPDPRQRRSHRADVLVLTAAGRQRSSEDEIFDALEEAEPLGFVNEVPGHREAQYAFVHEQFRQTLLGELSLPRRQRLHLRVADEIEGHATRSGASATVAIANHLELAGAVAPTDQTAGALADAPR